ncbi:MAG: DUF1127 domain-containing protein [Alphaproteobacteria bacterium]
MTSIQSQTLPQHHIVAPRVVTRVFGGTVTGLLRLPRMLVETLLTWQRRADERNRLATFDARLLRDMGISEADAAHEAAIPFWRIK